MILHICPALLMCLLLCSLRPYVVCISRVPTVCISGALLLPSQGSSHKDVKPAYLQEVLKERKNTRLVCFQSAIKRTQIINIPLEPHIQITKKRNQPQAENFFFGKDHFTFHLCRDAFTDDEEWEDGLRRCRCH